MRKQMNKLAYINTQVYRILKYLLIVYLCFINLAWTVQAKSNDSQVDEKSKTNLGTNLGPTLERISKQFQRVLAEEIDREKSLLGPILLFDQNKLKLIRGGQVVAEARAEPTLIYHQVKAYSDMCLLVAIRLSTIDDQKQRIEWASQFIKEVNEAQKLTVQLSLTSELKARQIALSALTYSLLENSQKSNFSKGLIHSYLKEVRPLIIKNFEVAAADHILQLDHAVGQLFEHLEPGERKRLHAITYGPRGTRSGNLIVQYLAQLLGQSSLTEGERVFYSENLQDQESVIDLVSKHNVELALGQLLFDDSLKLQRDILSDAAYQILSERTSNELSQSPIERLLKNRFTLPPNPEAE